MKNLSLILILLFSQIVLAQKVDYKNHIISVDKVEIAKVEVEKENFGLTKNFTLYSMSGEKLIIAVLSTEYESDKSDNSSLYYRFTFVPTNQTGIFKLSALSMEKGFANLVGKSKIIESGSLSESKVTEFIASKGVTPKIAVNYTVVSRKKNWPVQLNEDKTIEQESVQIGFFVNKAHMKGQDFYEFFLPSGILIAKVNFTGGNNAQNFELFTPKDNQQRIVSIPQKEKINFYQGTVDPNALTLKRITLWLIEKNYL